VIAANRALFDWIDHWPGWLAPLMRFLSEATNYLWFKILLALLVIWMIAFRPNTRRAAIQALIAFPIANGMTDLLKAFVPENRPYQDIIPGIVVRLGEAPSHGTASAHSANMAAVAFVFTYQLGWWGVPWAVIAFAVGLSRIYNGVHYPYQVVLGWLCGIVAGLVVTKTWDQIVRRRKSVNVDEADGIQAT
jgi:undecaprenyl-diphosphatase